MRSILHGLAAAAVTVAIVFFTPFSTTAQAPAGLRPDPDHYRGLHWRNIGPEGNRFSAAAGIPGDPHTYYVGAASGGIYKTTDGGVNWAPIFDDQPVQSIGALAVSQSDPNVVWAGTGEGKIRSHISVGQGVYKSTDGGESWILMGLEQTGRIPRVVIHPTNPGCRPRLRPGSRLRASAREGCIPDHGRRRDLGPRPLRGREHGVLGSGHGSDQSPDSLRRNLAARDPHLGTHQRGTRRRPPCLPGRWRHLDPACRERASRETGGEGGRGHRAVEPQPRLRHVRDRGRDSVEWAADGGRRSSGARRTGVGDGP